MISPPLFFFFLSDPLWVRWRMMMMMGADGLEGGDYILCIEVLFEAALAHLMPCGGVPSKAK